MGLLRPRELIQLWGMERRKGFGFYHVCTDGTVLPWMFRCENDFICGTNRIAVCKVISGVEVWAYTLMDNHVHFLLYGTLEMCKLFIVRYKFLTGMWISHLYDHSKYIKYLPVSIIPLKTEEDVLDTIAYIDRNAMLGGFSALPFNYPWASTRLLFRGSNGLYDDFNTSESRIKDFSRNQLRDILKTRVVLPENWIVDHKGMINPACFVEWEKVEKLFKSPARYLYYLTKKLEGKINLTLSDGTKSFVPDKDLRIITIGIARDKFNHEDIRTLDVNSRLKIARILKRDYASNVKQIARMLYLEYNVLKEFI